MQLNKNHLAFFELLRAGLWEKEARLSLFDGLDYFGIMRLAEEQSIAGLVTAGLEHVTDVRVPQNVISQFVGSALQLEQRNKSKNEFIAGLIDRMRNEGINNLLLKGQGIGQCYERPLWRACGDVD